MSNKRIQVSPDNGTNYYTLPGNTGEAVNELNTTTDTVYGQPFESNAVNIAQWNVTANGLYKGVAGYNIQIMKGGTPTSTSNEPMTAVSGSGGHQFQVTAAGHRTLALDYGITITDGGSGDITNTITAIDYLNGIITFSGSPAAPTLTGRYIPMTTMAKAKSFTLTQTAAAVDVTTYEDAQASNGHRSFQPGLKTVSLEVGHVFAVSNAWLTSLLARGVVYVQIDLDVSNPGLTVARGLFKIHSRNQSGNQGDPEMETVTLGLYVPDGSLVASPFNWYITTASKLNLGIQSVLTSWQAQSNLRVRYLPSGVVDGSGFYGDAFPIECTLTNSFDGLNSFSFNFRGVGQPTVS